MGSVPTILQEAPKVIDTAANVLGSLLPSGTVLPFAGSSAPSGWLLCDGAERSQTTYAALFAVLGTTYNTQFNEITGGNWAAPAGGNFRVPDYRGSFLRGVGTPSGLDAVTLGGRQVQKTAKNGLANSGGDVAGSVTALSGTAAAQSWSGSTTTAGAHYHNVGAGMANVPGGAGYTVMAINGPGGQGTTHDHTGHAHVVSGSNSSSSISGTGTWTRGTFTNPTIAGDNETRPINKGVNYIIKI